MDCDEAGAIMALPCVHASHVNELAVLQSAIDEAKAETESIEDRLRVNSLLIGAMVAANPSIGVQREIWAHERNERWFEETVPGLGVDKLRENFRVSPTTFRYIVDVCRADMERETSNMRRPISVEKRVAIGMYRLCSSAEDRTIANLFDVGRSTLNEVYREFCEVIVDRLRDTFLRIITPEELGNHIREFQAVCGFPQAAGAVDGCHIPISPPEKHATDYYNYKGWYCVVLLALVDHKYRFRYITVGSPGRCHDAYIFARSQLSTLLQSPAFQRPTAIITDTVVPPLILCDQAFPLKENMIKPFPHGAPRTPAQSHFNYKLSESRIVVENAFGRLKVRFRQLLKRMECNSDNVNVIVRACCILHNVCEHFNDVPDKSRTQEAQSVDRLREEPKHHSAVCTTGGDVVRNAILKHFAIVNASSESASITRHSRRRVRITLSEVIGTVPLIM